MAGQKRKSSVAALICAGTLLGAGYATAAVAEVGPRLIDGGQVVGVAGKNPGILIYKGIPYAAPPVGNLRWQPPQPVKPWEGIKVADQLGAACTGFNFGALTAMSEDCLYVNVWTPTSKKDAKLPVLFWIHGGGWQGGSGYHPAYDGEQFASHGVVVVTFNYRVGVFGFMAHPDLTKESGRHASGNYGLLDQIAALKWVHRNIEQFGGDPAKVTIAGESAGSYSVSVLTASPLSRGLFRGAIAESGAYVMPQRDAIRSLADSEKIGLEFARSVGADNIASLRAMSAESLMKAVGKMTDFFAFQPCVDGFMLPEPVYATYAKHQQAKVPVLIGSNTDEGAFLLPPQRPTKDELEAKINGTFGAKSQIVRDIYPTATPSDRVRSELNLYADVTFTYPMWKWASMSRQQGLPVYYYLFGRVLPSPPQQTYKGIPRTSIGAFHGDEMPYVFGNLNLVKSMLDGEPRDGRLERTDFELSDTMLGYWVNFVKTGNPNGEGLSPWPLYDGGTENSLMYFDENAGARRDARTDRLKVLDAALEP